MRPRSLLVAAVALSAVAAASGLRAGWAGRDTFPHARHAGLFPLCTGCHAGAAGGGKEALFPTQETCARCHDGKQERVVDWTAPHSRGTNVRFSHSAHARDLAESGLSADCGRCHTADGATTVRAAMRGLAGAQPQACIGCHAHQASSHLAEGALCRTCHLALAQATQLESSDIAGLPKPAGHESAGFVLSHGVNAGVARARCAICHTRESCGRCHLNGPSVPAIAVLESDPRVGALVRARGATYPRPASHRADWDTQHGQAARAASQSCANCHTQPGCRGCHIGEGARKQIAALPMPAPGGPSGALTPGGDRPEVRLEATPGGKNAMKGLAFVAPSTARVHAAGFADSHGPAAASGSSSCSSCHAKSFCSTCHAGSSRPVFHPVNFMARHGADAYGGSRNCGSCHNTESFCKTCHQGAGLSSSGRIDVAFHTGQPLWLLQHGEAARKGLEGCTSCHKQQDCTRCHSASGGWGVNPHGASFDANRMGDRNELTCARCHTVTPGRIPQ